MTTPQHLAEALRHRGYLFSAWPWRAVAYLVTTVPTAAVLSVGLLLVGAPLFAYVSAVRADGRPFDLPMVLFLAVGAVVLAAVAPVVSVAVAALERRRLGIADPRPLPAGRHRWASVAYAVFLGAVVPVAYWLLTLVAALDVMLIAGPWLASEADRVVLVWTTVDTPREALPFAVVGVLLLPLLAYLAGAVAAGQAFVARRLLRPAP
jgi:hypothetical protein